MLYLSNGKGQAAPIYLLDMGKPIKILDLAKKMISVSGTKDRTNDAEKDALNGIEFIGLRPGEKLHEELLIGGLTANTKHPKIRLAQEGPPEISKTKKLVEATQSPETGFYAEVSESVAMMFPDLHDNQKIDGNSRRLLFIRISPFVAHPNERAWLRFEFNTIAVAPVGFFLNITEQDLHLPT